MTSINHALTGAVIAFSIDNPALSLPLAFVSHFVCDAIPHYDPPGTNTQKFTSRRFVSELILGAVLCLLLVVLLALRRPHDWIFVAVAAFLATSPDLFWIKRFIYTRRHGKDQLPKNWLLRFHSFVQWKTSQKLIVLELVWFVVFGGIFISNL